MSLRPHLAATFWLGLPLVGAHVARNLLGVIDTVMVGRYGVEPLAALVLATSGFFILLMLGSGYAIGVLGVIASARAQGDDRAQGRIKAAVTQDLGLGGLAGQGDAQGG